jgi:hypothetical protein
MCDASKSNTPRKYPASCCLKSALPPNRRLQLTAFGARDQGYFDNFRRASAAAEAQHVGPL